MTGDMTMQLDKHYTVARIVEEKLAFTIPIYQRLFVWEEEQTRQLLEDLQKAASASPGQPYYIGVITVKKNDGEGKLFEVIDGQQRLTFLTLLGCELGWKDFVSQDEVLRIHYIGRSKDEEDIRNLLATPDSTQIVNLNFRRFQKVFREFASRNGFQKETFSNYVRSQCAFLFSELPANYGAYDLNLFFEKMNSTGKQLTPVEAVKGIWFAEHANLWNQCLNFDEALPQNAADNTSALEPMALGKILDSTDQEKSVLHQDRMVLRPEVLLLHVLRLTLGKDVSLDHEKMLQTFRQNGEALTREKTKAFMEHLQAYRRWLDANIIYLLVQEQQRFEYRFRDKDNKDNVGTEDKERQKLEQFQAMLYVSSGESQEWVLEAYLATNGAPLTLQTLKEQDKKRHPLPALENLCYGQIDRYWFWALDYLLWEQAMDGTLEGVDKGDLDAIKAYRFRRNRSIEHLHPQNPPPGQETEEWLKDRNEQKDCVRNSFGNLAMISSSFNSAQGNDSIRVKFARVEDTQLPSKTLESIKMLLMFRIAGGAETGWNPRISDSHGRKMYYDLLVHFYSVSGEGNTAGIK